VCLRVADVLVAELVVPVVVVPAVVVPVAVVVPSVDVVVVPVVLDIPGQVAAYAAPPPPTIITIDGATPRALWLSLIMRALLWLDIGESAPAARNHGPRIRAV
jgi:hypothetical protein